MSEISPRTESNTEAFRCPVLRGTARVTMQFLVIPETGMRKLTGGGCDCVAKCGIATHTAIGFDPDWSKCPKLGGLAKQG